MSFTIRRMSYLYSVRLVDKAVSNSGFEGGLETRTSSTGSTMPEPKKCGSGTSSMNGVP